MGCVEYWTGLHVDLHPIHSLLRTTWTAQERCKAPYAVAAEEAGRVVWLGWMGWLAWWGGWPGGVAGRMGRRAGLDGASGLLAGLVGWWAWLGVGLMVGGNGLLE